MKRVGQVLLWLYGIAAIYGGIFLTGAISRREMPFWFMRYRATTKEEMILASCSYLVFYSCFFTVPYMICAGLRDEGCLRRRSPILIGLWSLVTGLIFGPSTFVFLRGIGSGFGAAFRAFPASHWLQLLGGVWCVFSLLAVLPVIYGASRSWLIARWIDRETCEKFLEADRQRPLEMAYPWDSPGA